MIKDNQNTFGWGSIAFHWVSGVLVIWMFFLGQNLEHAEPGPDKFAAFQLHVSIGFLAFLAIALRTAWRVYNGGMPAPVKRQVWPLHILSVLVPWLLIAVTVTLIITGPLAIWTRGGAWEPFGLFALPSPTGEMDSVHDWLGGIHSFAGHIIAPLFILHVLGALKHLVWDRDRTLQRMLWVKSSQ